MSNGQRTRLPFAVHGSLTERSFSAGQNQLGLSMPVDCKTPKRGIEAASLTDVGLQRGNNEDSFLYWEPDSDDDFGRKGSLAAVADGMGGYEGGQEASRLAVETVRHIYDRDFDGNAQTTLVTALQSAHDMIQR